MIDWSGVSKPISSQDLRAGGAEQGKAIAELKLRPVKTGCEYDVRWLIRRRRGGLSQIVRYPPAAENVLVC